MCPVKLDCNYATENECVQFKMMGVSGSNEGPLIQFGFLFRKGGGGGSVGKVSKADTWK